MTYRIWTGKQKSGCWCGFSTIIYLWSPLHNLVDWIHEVIIHKLIKGEK